MTVNGDVIMYDSDKRIFIEVHSRSNEGWVKAFGLVFVAIMAIGILDHALTSALLTTARWIQ